MVHGCIFLLYEYSHNIFKLQSIERIKIHSKKDLYYLNIYIYIYVCVCVCMCERDGE